MRLYSNDTVIEEMAASGDYRVEPDGSLWTLQRWHSRDRNKKGEWRRCESRMPNGHLVVSAPGEKHIAAHRLVFRLWYGFLDSTKDIHHKDENASNNRPDNLVQLSRSEHLRESYRLGQQPSKKGENHPQAKLTADDVILMRSLAAQGVPHGELGEKFGILRTSVSNIVTGRSWGHIPLKENDSVH